MTVPTTMAVAVKRTESGGDWGREVTGVLLMPASVNVLVWGRKWGDFML